MNKTRNNFGLKRLGVGLLLLGLMAGPIGLSLHFNGIWLSPEAMDCAQLARNISRGRGFVTGVIRPASLLYNENIAGHPDLYQPPLPAVLLGAGFRIFGASDRVVVLWSLILFWITGLLVFLLLRRTWGPGGAFLGAALYFTNALLLNSVRQGDPSLLPSLLFILLLLSLARSDNSPVAWLISGLLCGFGYLSSSGIFWIGAFLLAGLHYSFPVIPGKSISGKKVSALLAGFVCPLLFWWGRNLAAGGFAFSPLRAAEYRMLTSLFPGDSLLRETSREIFGRAAGVKTLILKWWQGGESAYGRLLFLTGSFAAVFFYLALLLPFSDRKWSRLRYFIFGSLLLGIGQYVIFSRRTEDIRFLVPAALVLATGAFLFIVGKLGPSRSLYRTVATGLFIGLNLIPAVDQLRLSRAPVNYTRINCLGMRGQVPAGEVVITDQPEAVAWYGERAALWLPVEFETMAGLGYLYLTPAADSYPPLRGGDRVVSWPLVYRTRGRSTLWEAGDLVPLSGNQFLCRIVPNP